MNNYSELSETIKSIRLRNNISQSRLAELVFVSRQTVSNWERGTSTPSIDTLKVLSNIFSIPLPNLISQLSDKKNQSRDYLNKEDQETIIHSFLSIVALNDESLYNLENIIQESGLEAKQVKETFASVTSILNHIMDIIDGRINKNLKNNFDNNPFITIADNMLPIIYENIHIIKVLYSSDFTNGPWMRFLKSEYTTWVTPLFDDYTPNNHHINRAFAIDITVKMTLSIVSSWATQPIPIHPDHFRDIFIQITDTSLKDFLEL